MPRPQPAHISHVQDVQKLDEFCLVMECWFDENGNNGQPYKVLDNFLACHVWQMRCKGLVTISKGWENCPDQLSMAVKALELYGVPPIPDDA